ncbi:hypothetical protein ACE01C_01380 [Moraxella sp. ZJ171]
MAQNNAAKLPSKSSTQLPKTDKDRLTPSGGFVDWVILLCHVLLYNIARLHHIPKTVTDIPFLNFNF